MTGIERIGRILDLKPADRIGLYEHFWGDTCKKWQEQGKVGGQETLADHFGFDMDGVNPFNLYADIDFIDEVLEETNETILKKDGNGAILRTHKLHSATPEHVDFTVKERLQWEKIKPLLMPSEKRIDFNDYLKQKRECSDRNRFFMTKSPHAFELMKNVCGHEYMLMGMALDPDWVRDMADTYAEMYIGLFEILFARCGKPDGIWFYEDMGFKERPFMSPQMYREIMLPAHKKTFDYIHSLGCRVIVHSCGFVEPLVPYMIEAGMDCLQVIEVKAGMDVLRLKKNFGSRIALCGGMDARNLVANDIDAVRKELHQKIPELMKGGGYIFHSDHSIPDQVDYDTYRYFVNEGLKIGSAAN